MYVDKGNNKKLTHNYYMLILCRDDQFMIKTKIKYFLRCYPTSCLFLTEFQHALSCLVLSCLALGPCCPTPSSGCLLQKSKEHAEPIVSRDRP